MKLYVTYCSGQKDESLISSGEKVFPDRLYTSPRIQEFIQTCREKSAYWAIFSDKYGIWFPNETHEWYDKHPDEIMDAEFGRLILQSVKKLKNYDVFFYGNTEDPKFHPRYIQLIDHLRARCIPVTIFSDLSLIQQEKVDIVYEPSDRILFLAICSFGKSIEGFSSIPGPRAFRERINPDFSEQIVERRQMALNLVRDGKVIFNRANQRDHEFNTELLKGNGVEFGGTDTAYYLPALWRYDGRFYTALGSHGKKAILASPHHFLILSGLYGIVTPDEFIQCYSVPLYEGDPVQKVWTDGKFLSKALSAYLVKYNIQRIFDFTGIQYYHDLIDWDYLKKNNPGVEILHAFSTQGAGDNALRPFGEIIGNVLVFFNENELLSITPEQQFDDVYFRAIHQPWPDRPGDSKLPAEAIILHLEYVTDSDPGNILDSAEHETSRCVNSAYNPADAGSTILWHYSKGFERMMHHICAARVGRYLLRKYKNKEEIIRRLPQEIKFRYKKSYITIRKLALASTDSHENQLMLGDWANLSKDFEKAPSNIIVNDIQRFLMIEYGSKFDKLVRVCSELKDHRNPPTHSEIYSLDKALPIRDRIVTELNDVIQAFYQDRVWIEKLAKSEDLLDRLSAIKSFQNIAENWSVETLIKFLDDPSPKARRESAEALGNIGNLKALDSLKSHSNDSNTGVKFSINEAIRKIERQNKA